MDKQLQKKGNQIQIPPSIYQKDEQFYIVVNAKPNSKNSQISDISDEAVNINIAAPPRDGEANEELIQYLSGVLEIKKTQISISKGSRGRDKLVCVGRGFTSLQAFYSKLLSSL